MILWWMVSLCHLQAVWRIGHLRFTDIFPTKFCIAAWRLKDRLRKQTTWDIRDDSKYFLMIMYEIKCLGSVTCFLRWKSWGTRKENWASYDFQLLSNWRSLNTTYLHTKKKDKGSTGQCLIISNNRISKSMPISQEERTLPIFAEG